MDPDRRAALFARFGRSIRVPMLLLSVVFLIVVVLPVVLHVPPEVHHFLNRIMWIIWGIFAAELVIETYLAPKRRQFLRAHWPEVLTVIAPFLLALRLVTVLIALLRTWEELRLALRQQTFGLIGAISLITVVASAASVYAIERQADGPIKTFMDALWWAITTITTVGYGDVYPVTAAGRSIAVFLMLVGIGLFGVLAARVAAFFVEEEQRENEDPRLDAIAERLERIERQLAQGQEQTAARYDRKPLPARAKDVVKSE